MCLTIPGKILSIKEGMATVQNGREKVLIDLSLVFDAKPGDWVLYATNRAVKLISEQDAKEIRALLEDHYHPVDASKLALQFKKIIIKVRSGNSDLTKKEIEYLLGLKGKDNLETLYAEANSLRKEKIPDFVCIHGIIEFSNYCRNNCHYCGIRKDSPVSRYRLIKEEIIETAYLPVVEEGYKMLVLQSGEDMNYSDDDLIEIIRAMKKKMRVFIILSVGERSKTFYKKAFEAGATGSLMRFETSNPSLYAKMRPGHKLEDRIDLIKYKTKLGYYMASGGMVGLPGQTLSDLADDLLMIKKLKIPMVSAGPFIPSKNTPLENDKIDKAKRIELFLKCIAVARFIMPEVRIPVTTALETLDPENGRHKGFLAGANALMFSLTPAKHSGKYSIYDNKYREREKIWQKYGLFKGEESWKMLEERLNRKL